MVQELSNSSRRLPKATYVPIQFDQKTNSSLSRPFERAAALRRMQLRTAEVDAVRREMGERASSIPDASWAVFKQFEPQPVGVLMPGAEATLSLTTADIQVFGQALVDHRVSNLERTRQSAANPATQPPPVPAGSATMPPLNPTTGASPAGLPPGAVPDTSSFARPAAAGPSPGLAARADAAAASMQMAPTETLTARFAVSSVATMSPAVATDASLVTFAKSALQGFVQSIQITPIGRLHLERIEMTPAGIERGELLATIPLSPQETTSVIQKEWATTSDEFSSIVTDYLEQVSEKGVTEKSELAESLESQTKHDNQVDLSASVSGSYGFVSFAASSSAKLSDSLSSSEKLSRNHSIETTRKASTRSRKEHKVTITTSSVRGSEEVTARTLTNPSSTSPMRIDYFSMMRKWRVRLYRYGMRMTYDIAIPEPGAALREELAQLADLNAKLNSPFVFNLDPASIHRNNYQVLASEYGAALDPPPDDTWKGVFTCSPLRNSGDENGAQAQSIDISVPEGFQIVDVVVGGWASPAFNDGMVTVAFGARESYILKTLRISHTSMTDAFHDCTSRPNVGDYNQGDHDYIANGSKEVHFPSLVGLREKVSLPFISSYAGSGFLTATVYASLTSEAFLAWQQKCWQTLRQAASDAFYLGQQALVQQRDALKAKIADVDTLTLRQEELAEVMKGVLRWLLGPAFDFMPPDVQKLFGPGTGLSFTSNELGMDASGWAAMFTYQEMVKFIQQAIEWENLLYFLYPYFWDVPSAWDFVRSLEHPDLTRQTFVRAGSARVVITVRPGFEDAFSAFIEQGQLGQVLPPDHPYMTIAQEIQAYNETNYPGIPPANPAAIPVSPQDAAVTASSSKADTSTSPAILAVDATEGFQVGMAVTIDTHESTVQESQTIVEIPDSTHIKVSKLKFAHDGSSIPFPVVQPGESGVVIAEWYEYTPSHGTDIAITTPLPEME